MAQAWNTWDLNRGGGGGGRESVPFNSRDQEYKVSKIFIKSLLCLVGWWTILFTQRDSVQYNTAH